MNAKFASKHKQRKQKVAREDSSLESLQRQQRAIPLDFKLLTSRTVIGNKYTQLLHFSSEITKSG